MKPEMSEKLFIQELFEGSMKTDKISSTILKDIDRLTGDASTRRYYRTFTGKGTYVVCLGDPSQPNENNFINVQSFLEKINIRVPRIFDKELRKGYILQEDLGDTTFLSLLSQINSQEDELTYFKRALDMIILLHNVTEKEASVTGCFTEKFDLEKYMSEIDFSLKFFLGNFLEIKDEGLEKELRQMFKPVCERLAAEKMVLTHRDFHSRNMMYKDGEIIMIDFQDARWGIPQYDLVSLLEDCYYKVDNANKEKLIEYYCSQISSGIHQQKDFTRLYQDMLIQRVFKAVGSFSYIYAMRSDKRYLKYISFGMEKIKETLLRYPEFSNLRKTLFKAYYES